jgi:hypothetical protein
VNGREHVVRSEVSWLERTNCVMAGTPMPMSTPVSVTTDHQL